MDDGTAQRTLIAPWKLAKIHWKSEAWANLFFGMPLALLMILSWDVGLSAFYKIFLLYAGLYFFVYFPFFGILPHITLKPILKYTDKVKNNESLTTKEASDLVTFLVNFSPIAGLRIVIIVFSAFLFAALLIFLRVIPELENISLMAGIVTVVLGVIVSTTEALLNIIFIEKELQDDIEHVLTQHNEILLSPLDIKPIALNKKIFIFALVTTLAGQTAMMLFFLSNTLLVQPDYLAKHILYVVILITLNTIFLAVLTPAAARILTNPLRKTIEWSKKVTSGDLTSKILIKTNDEIGVVSYYSNQMIESLGSTQKQLQDSLQSLNREQALLKIERNKLDAVITGVVDGVVALDADKNIIVFNRAMERITGWRTNEVLGKNVDAIIQLQDEDGTRYFSDTYCTPIPSPTAETPNTIEKQVLTLTTKTQQQRVVNLSASIIHDAIQTETTYIIALHDITKEHQAETMKIDIVSMAAHELRTPLTAINGYMSVILDEFSGKFGEEENTFLQRVQISAQQLASLVDNLLNVTRLEQDRLTLQIQTIDWLTLIRDIVDEFRFQAAEKQIVVKFEEPLVQFPPIQADKLRMTEVLMNLISNAVKYTDNGGKVFVSVELEEDTITTHVRDSGVGIPPKSLAQLFTKFYRVDNRLSTQNKGTGLGLYITKAIIELHHGTIWVDSEVDKGTTFSFNIPLIQPQDPNNVELAPRQN